LYLQLKNVSSICLVFFQGCYILIIFQINTIKADTKLNKLTPVLSATIKKAQRLHSVDASTQTVPETPEGTPKKTQGLESKPHIKREHSGTRDSSDGPFLTPPSDYPLTIQTAKKPARRQIPFPPQENVPQTAQIQPPFDNPPLPVPCPYPPPGYQFLPQSSYNTNWPQENGEYSVQPVTEPFQPISVITNGCTDYRYNEHQPFSELPEQEAVNTAPIPEDALDKLFGDGPVEAAEPDYNWDQIEEEMARLYGEAFTEDDGKALSEPEIEPEVKPAAPPEDQDDVNLELLGRLHEAQLQSRLEHIRKHWPLERQARLKRRFVELFGREDEEDLLAQVSPKEAAKCKQRIAPWIVKHLMPLYKEKRIASRHLFKSLAKHISDLLIQRNLHPGKNHFYVLSELF